MTNPTPMTRARELLTHWVDNDWFMPGYDGNLSTDLVIEHLAAALSRERQEALMEAFKECEAIARSKIIKSASHDGVDWNKACRDVAIAIRAAAIERLRDSK